ncbi:MAG: cardiolipin synthase [Lachnospiraceae bacterium]|nr:cardiolipin synthase [Lachnospiraceae bacterium]
MEDKDQTYLRLAEPRKKGLMSLLFSRFFLIVILLLIQIMIYVSILSWLQKYTTHFMVIQFVFVLVMVAFLFNSSIDNSAKLTWMFFISILPFMGAVMFWFTQTNLGHRTMKRRVEQLIEKTKNAIPQQENVINEISGCSDGTDDLATYLGRSSCHPVFKNTEVKYFPTGEAKFAAMLEELKKAEKFIFMEYFIVEEGYMWGKILEILIEKAKAGVDVRVMYDGMCEVSLLPSNYCELLAERGIRAKAFSPIKPLLSSHYNYRDHRKILVIDGKVAFNGGVNLADEYINRVERFGHWKDTAVMLKGDAVRSFTLMFLQMWNITEDNDVFDPYIGSTGYAPANPDGYVIPYGDCPLDKDKAGESVYMDMLYRAQDYVHIMTPYLILDGELEAAMKYAAERGVDVKLILPGIPDKKPPYALAKSHYKSLNNSGVKIYEYTPGFIHAKVAVSDNCKAIVGTINMDYRSLYHHFECATYMYKTSCISDIEADFQDTLSKCTPVTEYSIKNEKLSYKLMGIVMKFIAPLI